MQISSSDMGYPLAVDFLLNRDAKSTDERRKAIAALPPRFPDHLQ